MRNIFFTGYQFNSLHLDEVFLPGRAFYCRLIMALKSSFYKEESLTVLIGAAFNRERKLFVRDNLSSYPVSVGSNTNFILFKII